MAVRRENSLSNEHTRATLGSAGYARIGPSHWRREVSSTHRPNPCVRPRGGALLTPTHGSWIPQSCCRSTKRLSAMGRPVRIEPRTTLGLRVLVGTRRRSVPPAQ